MRVASPELVGSSIPIEVEYQEWFGEAEGIVDLG